MNQLFGLRHLKFYRPPGKVMFSEKSVSHSVYRGVCGPRRVSALRGDLGSRGGSLPTRGAYRQSANDMQHFTSSGHCSGRYTSYWNAFLLTIIFICFVVFRFVFH